MKLLLLVEVVKLMYPDRNDFGPAPFDQEILIFPTLQAGVGSYWSLEILNHLPPHSKKYSTSSRQ